MYPSFRFKEDPVNTIEKVPSVAILILGFLIAAAAPGARALASTGGPKEKAVAALEEDVKADPQNAELWLHLGFAYRKSDQLDKAQQAFEKVHTMDPRNEDALFML